MAMLYCGYSRPWDNAHKPQVRSHNLANGFTTETGTWYSLSHCCLFPIQSHRYYQIIIFQYYLWLTLPCTLPKTCGKGTFLHLANHDMSYFSLLKIHIIFAYRYPHHTLHVRSISHNSLCWLLTDPRPVHVGPVAVWVMWQRGRFFPEYFSFPVPVSCH